MKNGLLTIESRLDLPQTGIKHTFTNYTFHILTGYKPIFFYKLYPQLWNLQNCVLQSDNHKQSYQPKWKKRKVSLEKSRGVYEGVVIHLRISCRPKNVQIYFEIVPGDLAEVILTLLVLEVTVEDEGLLVKLTVMLSQPCQRTHWGWGSQSWLI